MMSLNFFLYNPQATRLIIPEGVECLGERVFDGCEKLEYVKLPSRLREIGHGAFANCKSLKSIRIPEGVKKLGEDVFKFCEQLKQVDLPSSLREIERGTFTYCKSLRRINIPEESSVLRSMYFLVVRNYRL